MAAAVSFFRDAVNLGVMAFLDIGRRLKALESSIASQSLHGSTEVSQKMSAGVLPSTGRQNKSGTSRVALWRAIEECPCVDIWHRSALIQTATAGWIDVGGDCAGPAGKT